MILNSKAKIILTVTATLMVLGLLLWEHFHGGVASHYILQNEDLPKISNWWSLLSIPTMTWISLSLIQKRHTNSDGQTPLTKSEIYGFTGAFVFGLLMTILFYNAPDYPSYLLLPTFVLALFIPIYKPEYYLGFILSMMFGFGGVLPVIFGLLLVAVYAIEYVLIRRAFLFIFNRISKG